MARQSSSDRQTVTIYGDYGYDWHSVEVDLIASITRLCDKIQVKTIALLSAVDTEDEPIPFTEDELNTADANPLAAGLRETFEEIGVPQAAVTVIGELPGEISKFGLWVMPYVGLISADQAVTANPSEVASIFEIPMDWLSANPPNEIERLDRHGETQWAPVYYFDNYRVWGLTALILASLVDISGISDHEPVR